MNRHGDFPRNLYWVHLPQAPAALDTLVLSGSGKDLEMRVELAGGATLLTAVDKVRVGTDSRTVGDLVRIDDRSLSMRYSGPDLTLVDMCAAWPTADGFGAEVAEEIRATFAAVATGGGTHVLNAAVLIELELRGAAQAAPGSAPASATRQATGGGHT